LPGAFNVANALAAAALADLAELPGDAIRAGLAAVAAVPGRMERIDGADRGPVFVDYAHTPDALDAVLVAARRFVTGPGRVIVVFGCGGDRDRAKRPEMGAVAVRRADLVFVTSDNPRSERPEDIAAEIVAGMVSRASATVELDRREAIRSAIAAWRPGDVVVVAGKGHETGQTAAGETRPFDDRAEVRAALGGDA
ncbi:MAG: glutamate ligase domain-containing protein, partial [Actinomycetota bacterium]